MPDTRIPAKGRVCEFQRQDIFWGQPPGYAGGSPQTGTAAGGSQGWMLVPPHALSMRPIGTDGPSASASALPAK